MLVFIAPGHDFVTESHTILHLLTSAKGTFHEKALDEAVCKSHVAQNDNAQNIYHKPANLKAVMDAKGDIATAHEAVGTLATTASQRTGLKIRIPACPKIPTQVTTLEIELMDLVGGLKSRNRIFGEPPTIEELLDPVEEREVGDHDYEFPGGDNEIVEEV
ncbi:hypothetical protein BDR07DRAFT_1464425 [Suillus spraguei]|nr:hypothetical protein BDR07DRAFT_1464425 [Suillus spraguei]